MKIKKWIRKTLIFLLVLGVIAVIVITFTNLAGDQLFGKKKHTLMIDADSGWHFDDVYALTRAIVSTETEVMGIGSSHFAIHPVLGDSSQELSHRMNNDLLDILSVSSMVSYRGAHDMLWYEDIPKPRYNDFSAAIVRNTKELESGKKLNILALGSMTNIASAILMDQDIAYKLRVFALVMNYDPKGKVWNKNEFNARCDLEALDILLNNSELELIIMPRNIAGKAQFRYNEAVDIMESGQERGQFLMKLWENTADTRTEIALPSVSLLEAIIKPDLVRKEPVLPPPENTQRSIDVITKINENLIPASFWSAIIKYFRNQE